MNFSFGLELEAIDFDRREVILPEGCWWSRKEITLINSNGVAIDPTGKTGNFMGGEINTPAVYSLDECIKLGEDCFRAIRDAGGGVNYRCNTQVHIGFNFGEEKANLMALKAIQKESYENWKYYLMNTMGEGQFKRKKEYGFAFWSHYTERPLRAHKHLAMMRAQTLHDYREASFLSKTGRRAFQTFQRQYINTHAWFKYGTVEFRNFWATLDTELLKNCVLWSLNFTKMCLGYLNKREFLTFCENVELPKELPYDDYLEKEFYKTKITKAKKEYLKALNLKGKKYAINSIKKQNS